MAMPLARPLFSRLRFPSPGEGAGDPAQRGIMLLRDGLEARGLLAARV